MNNATKVDAAAPTIDAKRLDRLRKNLIDPAKIELRDLQRILSADPNTPIFVMNRSDRNQKRPRGQVHISINDNGEVSMLKIPKTFVPIEITTLFPASTIMRSQNFLRTVAEGKVTLHDPNESLEYLSNSEAQREIDRLRNIDDKYNEEMDAEMAKISTEVKPKDASGDVSVEVATDDEAPRKKSARETSRIVSKDQVRGESEAIGVLWRVYNVVNDRDITADRMLNALRNITGEKFRIKDFDYIKEKCRETRVREWAQMNIDEIKEALANKED